VKPVVLAEVLIISLMVSVQLLAISMPNWRNFDHSYKL